MLDDHARRRVEDVHATPGGVGIGDVVERQLLALQLAIVGNRAGRCIRFTVQRRLLMRVLAIAHVLHLLTVQEQDVRKRLRRAARIPAPEPRCNRAVVRGRMGERLLHQSEPQLEREATLVLA